jgi:hypothetical protein
MNEKTKIPLKVVFVLFYYLNFTIFYKVDAINTSLTIVLKILVNRILLFILTIQKWTVHCALCTVCNPCVCNCESALCIALSGKCFFFFFFG